MPITKKVFVLVFSFVAFLPLLSFAAGFTNPLCPTGENCPTIQSAVVRLINFMLGLVGVLSIAALVYGGIFYIISLGNDSRVTTAKKTITWAIIGLVVSLISVLMVRFVGRTLGVTQPAGEGAPLVPPGGGASGGELPPLRPPAGI